MNALAEQHPVATRFPVLVRAAHWLTALAILAAYLLAEGGEDESGGGAMRGHYLAGVVVLVLLIVRVSAMAFGRYPPIVPPPGRLSTLLARLTHLALYAFLLIEPVLGILQVNFAGHPVTLPGGWSLPMLVGTDHAWQERIGEWHEELGEFFYWVIGLHIVGALWHRFVARDNAVQRMI